MSEENLIIKRASQLSLVVSIFVLSLKIFAYFKTGSQAVLSDALESIVNVIAAFVAVWIIHVSLRPADKDHPYGHGKLENFSAAFEGGLVAFAAVIIFAESIKSLVRGEPIQHIDQGIFYVTLASILNLGLGLYLKYVSKKFGSEALYSSALHVLSDLWTTVGAVVGMILVSVTGYLWVDSATAIVMAFYLAYTGLRVVKSSIDGLMDSTDEKSLQKLADVCEKNRYPGIIDIHQTRIIRAGQFHHVDAHVVVPQFWSVVEVHKHTGDFEKSVVLAYDRSGEIAFHVDPCNQNYCESCNLSLCPIRQFEFKKTIEFSSKTLTRAP
jgi:cation diffusion facilitator family transporter